MSVKVRVRKVDTAAVVRRIRAMRRRSKDFRNVFRWALLELEKAHNKNFSARGTMAGPAWKPLDTEYASWKLANYGAKGILVREGDLRSSLTDFNSRGAVRDVGRHKATFGTSIGYAGFHQAGTSNMARRKVVFVPRRFAHGVAEAVAERVVYGSEVGQTYTHLRNGLFS